MYVKSVLSPFVDFCRLFTCLCRLLSTFVDFCRLSVTFSNTLLAGNLLGLIDFGVHFLAFGFLIFGCWILRRGVPRNWGVEPMTETSNFEQAREEIARKAIGPLEVQPLVLFLLVQKEELRHLEENHE